MRDPRPLPVAVTATRALALFPSRALLLPAAGAVAFAGLMAVAAQPQLRVLLPFKPVPVTLQTGVALLAGATLGPLAGAAAMVLYLLAGVAGFSVFTTGAVMGATAGYLLAFVPAAFLTGWLRERRGWLGMATGMCLGEALILLGGATGLCLLKHSAFLPALALGVAPFLFGDALKLVAAAATARLTVPAWRSLLRPR